MKFYQTVEQDEQGTLLVKITTKLESDEKKKINAMG